MNVDRLEHELAFHPDANFSRYLCNSFRNGFDTLISEYPRDNVECRNLLSARKQPDIVANLLQQECLKGFLLGPFNTPPFSHYRISPIGIATGKYSDKKRLIVDLSSPHDNVDCQSINELIDKDQCSLSYVKIDDAIKLIQKSGPGSKLCKFDICDAFKLCPIMKEQWHLYGIKWSEQYYFYHRLVFGSRSSPKLFDYLSQAICWIAENNYNVSIILHLLDDFLTIDKPDDCGERTMTVVKSIFHRLNIPLSAKKTIGPACIVEYLGIILDTELMQARLPQEKVTRMTDFLVKVCNSKTCTKLELLQLLGHLNFASRVILQGRSFVSYLITLSTTVKQLHHRVTLSSECRLDIAMWLRFLRDWNGVSMFYDVDVTTAPDMALFTDAASTVGFGGFFDGQWFAEKWSPIMLSEIDSSYTMSMTFMELYPIVVAAIVWGDLWRSKRILFYCDNLGTVEVLRKGRSRSSLVMKLMRRLTWCAAKFNFTVLAEHIPGVHNTIADHLSRFQISEFFRICPQANPVRQLCPPHSEVMWY